VTAPSLAPEPIRPFSHAAHCHRITAHGGAVTVPRHGTAHMRAIGTAGASVAIQRHGLVASRFDAALAAET
jgi:hypothetical protein